jgi:hypothetical protein
MLPMEAMAANAPRIPSTTGLPLALGVLVSVATLPARFRVVILKR